jgi:hypothetical protein
VEEEGREALNPKEEWLPARVEAKTDVVRCESIRLFYSNQSCVSSPTLLVFCTLASHLPGSSSAQS